MAGRKDPTPPSAGNGACPTNSAVVNCPDDPCGRDAISNVTQCCGAEIFTAAKQSNGGIDPRIVFGTPSSGFDAETDTTTGKITVDAESDLCTATESVFFELANLAAKPAFDSTANDASAGNLGREEYTRATEKGEYENMRTTLAAIDKCKDMWGCQSHPFDFEAFRPATDFDDYYEHYLGESHKNHYRTAWDENYKAAYDANHPPGP